MMNIRNLVTSYYPPLSNALDDIDDFIVPDLLEGDIVKFSPYYESDEGGVGIIKEITMCEFKNKKYDPTNPDSPLFISLPTAIVVSALPNEQWLDYVPITSISLIMTLDEVMSEYAQTFSEQDEIEVLPMRVSIARRLSDIRAKHWNSQRSMPTLPAGEQAVSMEASA